MKIFYLFCISLLILIGCQNREKRTFPVVEKKNNYFVIVKSGWENNKITNEWRKALITRQDKEYLDSLAQVQRPLTQEEKEWFDLIKSRAHYWTLLRDSLQVPFGNRKINDTTYVLLGYQGSDDGFTFEYQTVCFDLTALHKAYGYAKDSINTNRMDRLFAHEYTHLLSKDWARRYKLNLPNYKDSILWECIYEGLGMYRSMSSKWFPNRNTLSKTSSETFETLYPIFAERLITIDTSKYLSGSDKVKLHKNLSRGSMKQKWGALPVAVWLAMAAEGEDTNLLKWVEMGPDAVIPLAKKYLTGEDKIKFNQAFEKTSVPTL